VFEEQVVLNRPKLGLPHPEAGSHPCTDLNPGQKLGSYEFSPSVTSMKK